MEPEQVTRLLALAIGAIIAGSMLVQAYVYPLYASTAGSILFTVGLPLVFGAVVIADVLGSQWRRLDAVLGLAATGTLGIALWSLYTLYAATGGVFFGGVLTFTASMVLFGCLLVREVYDLVAEDRNPPRPKHSEQT